MKHANCALILLFMILLGCNPGTSRREIIPSPTPISSGRESDAVVTVSTTAAVEHMDTPAVTPEEDTSWKEYESQAYGFSLLYPRDIQLAEQPAVPGILLWLGFSYPDDPGDPSKYEPPFGLIVYANPEHLPLIDWFSAHMGDPPERGRPPAEAVVFYDPFIENQDPFQDRPALQYESGAWPIRYEKLVEQDGWVIGLYYHRDHPIGYEPAYEQMLASLQLFSPLSVLTATETPTRSTPTPTACLDEQAKPLALPLKREPLKLRFISDGNIWVWEEPEGVSRQISDTGDALRFTFSPDEEVIAFERPVGNYPDGPYNVELWAIDQDGGSLRRLVSAKQFDEFLTERHEAWMANLPRDYRWLPGTHQLTFGVYPSVNAVGGSDAAQGYWAVDLDTLVLEEWDEPEVIDPYAAIRMPSPDGGKIALVDRMSISLLNADGSIIRKDILTYPQWACGEGPCWLAPTVVWAPDSQSMRAIIWDEDAFGESFSVWEIPADGSPAQKLHTFSGMAYYTFISPNQEYIAYLRRVQPMSNEHELHLAKFDGSEDIIYTTGYQLNFQSWMPDSVHFVYDLFSVRQPFLGGVCSGSVPLIDPGETPATWITWVDAHHFLFVSGSESGQRQLRLGQLGGSSILIGPFNGDGAYYEVRQEGQETSISKEKPDE